MGVLYKIRMALTRLMYGRNGVDQLARVGVWTCLAVELVSMLVVRKWPLAGSVLYYGSLAVWIWVMFRIFSKNLYKRRAENGKWLAFQERIAGSRARRADKEHKYFVCKQCKTVCRVPVGKGKIVITCPKCGAQIKGKS